MRITDKPKLDRLAELDRRTLIEELGVVLDRELVRRGIDVGTLEAIGPTQTTSEPGNRATEGRNAIAGHSGGRIDVTA